MEFIYYVPILVLAGVLSLLPGFDFVGFNPWGWPVWLLVVLGGYIVLSAISMTTGKGYTDVNIYYQKASASPYEWTRDDDRQIARPLDALVLSAGLLDEALMGLSIEPLVFGFLSPELKNRLKPSFFPSGPPIRSAERDNAATSMKRVIRSVFHFVSAPVTAALLRAMFPNLTF